MKIIKKKFLHEYKTWKILAINCNIDGNIDIGDINIVNNNKWNMSKKNEKE